MRRLRAKPTRRRPTAVAWRGPAQRRRPAPIVGRSVPTHAGRSWTRGSTKRPIPCTPASKPSASAQLPEADVLLCAQARQNQLRNDVLEAKSAAGPAECVIDGNGLQLHATECPAGSIPPLRVHTSARLRALTTTVLLWAASSRQHDLHNAFGCQALQTQEFPATFSAVGCAQRGKGCTPAGNTQNAPHSQPWAAYTTSRMRAWQ